MLVTSFKAGLSLKLYGVHMSVIVMIMFMVIIFGSK